MNNQILKNIKLSTEEGLIFLDNHLNIKYINDSAKKLFKDNEYINKNIKSYLKTIKELKKPLIINDETFDITVTDVIEKDEPIGKIILLKNINYLAKKYNQKKELSYIDELTTVYNRRYFEKKILEMDKRIYFPLSVVIIDINNLKIINDVFNHKAGDKLITKTTKIIKKNIDRNSVFSRTGGDEFAILIPNKTKDEVFQIIKKLEYKINKEKISNISFSSSFGFETKTSEKECIKNIIKAAEDYMYKNKFIQSKNHKKEIINVIINDIYFEKIKTKKEAESISKMCEEFSTKLKLETNQIKKLKTAGLVYDIGKIAVKKKNLSKKGLTINEKVELTRHVEIGSNILKLSKEYYEIIEISESYQENYDGTGYPQKLKKEEIIIEARILSIINEYFKLKKKYEFKEIKKLLLKESNKKFDLNILKKFIKFLEEK